MEDDFDTDPQDVGLPLEAMPLPLPPPAASPMRWARASGLFFWVFFVMDVSTHMRLQAAAAAVVLWWWFNSPGPCAGGTSMSLRSSTRGCRSPLPCSRSCSSG